MESSDKKEINFWPYAIVGMILTVVMLSVWTIKVALKNPVQLENSYMMKYQDVDDNINEILLKQRAFDAKYSVSLEGNRLQRQGNRVSVVLTDKAGAPLEGAEIVALVTRPDSTEYDIRLNRFTREGVEYRSETFDLPKDGRWNIVVRIKAGRDEGFKTYKTFVK
ncbi:FixH family protein [Hydrogenimonas sp.]